MFFSVNGRRRFLEVKSLMEQYESSQDNHVFLWGFYSFLVDRPKERKR